jgi:hypothetical protein
MTPERIAAIVARWVRFYTRGVSSNVALRRSGEIDADLHDQIAHARAAGIGEWRIVLAIASRMVRGVVADLAWRQRQPKKKTSSMYRSARRVALGVAVILSLPFLAMQFGSGVDWSVGDFVAAGVLLAVVGIAIELALRRAGSVVLAIGIASIGLAAAVFGNADDAPGLVLLGILLVAGGCAIGVRRAQRSS